MADHLVTKFWGLCPALIVALVTLALAPAGAEASGPGSSALSQLGSVVPAPAQAAVAAALAQVPSPPVVPAAPSPPRVAAPVTSPPPPDMPPPAAAAVVDAAAAAEGGAAHASAGQRSLDGDSFRADSLGTHDGQTAASARSSPVRIVPRWAGERTSRLASEGAPDRAEGSGASGAEAGGRASCGHRCVRYARRLASRPRRIRAPQPRGVRFGSSHRHPEGFAWQTSRR